MSLSDVDELVYSWAWRKGGREATIKPSSLSIIKTANKPNQMSLSGVVELVYSWAWRACLLVSLSGVDKLFYSWACLALTSLSIRELDEMEGKTNQIRWAYLALTSLSIPELDELVYSWADEKDKPSSVHRPPIPLQSLAFDDIAAQEFSSKSFSSLAATKRSSGWSVSV